ncbi:MAG: cytochrome b N-terminal domain-containing protein [Kofleriaceae bacterium]
MTDRLARARGFLRERLGGPEASSSLIEGGASFAYVFGAVLAFLLVVEAATGLALAAFYSPSATDAWASVAYIQDRASWGWVVRGVHHHGGAAIVVVAGLHLVQTAVAGAYRRPRELVWWLGVLLLVLVLAWAVTGYVLRWDQAGFWANRVEMQIASGTPLVGQQVREVAIGGNEYGNLTLTRFYALHVILLPAIVTLVTVFHVRLARRHGPTPLRARPASPRWPDQALRNAIAMAIVFAILLGYVVSQHGADLAAPADASRAYDARPLWYLRWLFELRTLTNSELVALVAPAVVGGFLVGLPLLDTGPDRAPRRRLVWLAACAGLFAVIGALTVMSLARDAGDDALAKRRVEADQLATRARMLARENGVPVTGAHDIYATAPHYTARAIYTERCANCHDAESKERKGPIIAAGHGDRAWLKAFLVDPRHDRFWGKTKLVARTLEAEAAEKEDSPSAAIDAAEFTRAMPPVTVTGKDLEDLVEFVYAQSGAPDVTEAKQQAGAKVYADASCDDCHASKEGEVGASAPNLFGLGSTAYYTDFVGNPKLPIHMNADKSEMPRFDRELSHAEREALAIYLDWLRTATVADVEALAD